MTNKEEYDEYDEVNNDIAIIGMAGRFPKADNIDEFWTNLVSSTDCISRFSLEELEKMGVDPAVLANPNYVPAAGFIADQDKFDAHFFEMNPREAANLDPQHRFGLEVAWQTLEHAGYTPESVNGSIGVFAGVNMSTYFIFNLLKGDEATKGEEILELQISVDKDMFASRISYKLNLSGPSIALGTACSTSLVCVHLACQSLLNGESKMALAGGSNIATPNCTGHVYFQGGYSSPDGYCRSFDAKGKGTVGGSGTCFLLLKRLDDALADNDTIYAVIKGSAVNNDGSEKIGYTAPSIVGQTNIIAEAQAVAGIEPDSIRFIEAHGTATELGDPIEFAALTRAFRLQTEEKNFCGIGSVKSNIGHLGVAAGAASMVKAALSLKNKVIPESLNFETPNPKLDIDNSPFYVIDKLERIAPGEFPARAGISSLGIGGTNAHIVLEEPPATESSASRAWQLVLLSAKTPSALDRMSENLSAYMNKATGDAIGDVAHTLQVGRKGFAFRRAFVVPADNLSRIAPAIAPNKGFTGKMPDKQKKVVFMFPGGGTQYVNMARGLYHQEPAFKEIFDTCGALFKRKMGLDLVDLIYPQDERIAENGELLQRPKNFFAALFAVEYSLAKLWMSWGLNPDALIGHSLGEYTAACIAGVFSLEDAVSLICCRGALFEKIEKGGMLSVTLPAAQVQAMLIDGVSIATINDPGRCVVAGRFEPMQAFEKLLEEQQIEYKKLLIDTAGHSPMVDPILQEFGQFLATIKFKKPTLPFISNISGDWADPDEICTATYWKNHLRQTVRFADGVSTLLQEENSIFFEVGPGNALCSFVRSQLQPNSESVLLNTLRHVKEEKDDLCHLLETMGKLWLAGGVIDWKAFYAQEKRKRIALPTYPFERKRYWVDMQKNQAQAGAKLPVADWFWQSAWRLDERKPATPTIGALGTVWLFVDDQQYGAGIAQDLRARGTRVITIRHGSAFAEIDENCFHINAANSAEYRKLVAHLLSHDAAPQSIVHCWSLSRSASEEQQLVNGHLSFVYLAQALQAEKYDEQVNILGVTSQREAVLADDGIDCMQALIAGPSKIIPYEYPSMRFVTLDVNMSATAAVDFARFAIRELALLAEQSTDSAGSFNSSVALRNQMRFVRDFVPLDTAKPADQDTQPVNIVKNGVYLVTGGLGGVGMVHAQALAAYQTRLVLLQRTAFPAAAEWDAILADPAKSALLKEQINGIRSLQAAGAQVQVLQADVADAAQLAKALAQVRQIFGPVDGLIHCAGYGEFVPIKDTSKEVIDAVLAPKVSGTRELLAALAGENLSLVLLCSSMSVATTGYGLVGYVSACAYLDALAHAHLRNGGNPATRFLSINWDVWSTPQQTIKLQQDSVQLQRMQDNKAAILPREGIDVIYRALACGQPQAIISTTDFQQLLRKNRKMSDALLAEVLDDGSNDMQPDHSSMYERPSLSTEYMAPSSAEEILLASIWQETLGISKVGINDNFFELGGESLLGVKIVVKAKKMGLLIDPKQMFATPTIAQIVQNLGASSALVVDQSQVSGESACTAAQQQFLNASWANKDHWNVGIVLDIAQAITASQFKDIAATLIGQHDVLRSHFSRNQAGQWRQLYDAASIDGNVEYIDLSSFDRPAFSEQLQQHCQRLQTEISVASGPVFKLAYFKASAAPDKLAILAHHLVMDAVSLGVVMEDLSVLLAGVAEGSGRGLSQQLPPKTSSYKDFSIKLSEHVNSGALQADVDYWRKIADDQSAAPSAVRLDIPGGSNLERDTDTVSHCLSAELTQTLLQDAARQSGLKANELLLAALVKTLSDWQRQSGAVMGAVPIDLVGHGRPAFDDLDLSRTVGWFGTGACLPLLLAYAPLPVQVLSVKSQVDAVPHQGLSLSWLRELHESPALKAVLARLPKAAVSLNYLGQIDQLAQGGLASAAQESIRHLRDPANDRLYQHDIIAYSQDGRITLNWSFSKNQYHKASIQGLLEGLVECLQQLAHIDWNQAHAAYARRDLSDAILAANGIAADQVEACHGLTALQSEIYRLHDERANSPCNVSQALNVLEGALDKSLLQAVWQALVARHQVLRSRFIRDAHGMPMQVICRQADFSLVELDYSSLSETAQQQALQQLMAKDRQTRYDLTQAPALRLYHVSLAPQTGKFAILLSNHQIILDGWTSSLLSRDLLTCLMHMAMSKELPASDSHSNFSGYLDWLARQSSGASEAYWRETLAGYRPHEPLQNLMSAAPLLADGEDGYADYELVIDDTMLERIHECARVTRTTGNAVFQAAWALSLAQLSGRHDIVYGVTVSGRSANYEGIAEVVGQCTNSLPVRIVATTGMSVAQLLQSVHAANAHAQTHNTLSLSHIAALSRLDSGTPLYSSNVIFENIPRSDTEGAAMPIKALSSRWFDGWHFPLRLFVVPEDKTWVRLAYDGKLFAPANIAQLAERYHANLAALIRQTDAPVSSLLGG